MNILKIVITTTLVVATGSVFAEAIYPPEVPFVSSKTRADVNHELIQDGDQGGADDAPSAHPAESAKTRAAVKAELNANATMPNREFDPVRINAGH